MICIGKAVTLALASLPILIAPRLKPTLAASLKVHPPLSIVITSPKEAEKVPVRPFVVGQVTDPGAKVWIVVHPMETSDYWVQPQVTTDKSGKWEVQIYVGGPGNLDRGKKFEIVALANPKAHLHQGDVMGGWPEAATQSQVVRVFRR